MTRFETYSAILARCGYPLLPRMHLLDFGCGAGQFVQEARGHLEAYGCDLFPGMQESTFVRRIETPYRLPFRDAMFDVIVSDQVFEHVQNYEAVLDELARVLKPNGVMLHIFPSIWRPIETHIWVPLASFFRPMWWLKLWASLGVRNEYQRGLSNREVAAQNFAWLRSGTNYLSAREIRERFRKRFDVRNVEGAFMASSARAKLFLFPSLYRAFHSRILIAHPKRLVLEHLDRLDTHDVTM